MYKNTKIRPKDPKTKQPISLEDASRKLAKSKAFEKSLRLKLGGNKFKNPKDVAEQLQDPQRIAKFFTDRTKRPQKQATVLSEKKQEIKPTV